MLITLIVLAVLNLLVLGYIACKMPERVEVQNVFTCGDVATASEIVGMVRGKQVHRPSAPTV